MARSPRSSAPAVEVILRAPPPLDVPLRVSRDGDTVRALDASERLIAEARPADLHLEVPPAPSDERVHGAEARFAGATSHVFAECVVCGPARTPGDGLRIFAGPVEGEQGLVAARWTPHESLGDGDRVGAEHVWAALDCPGYFASGLAEAHRAAVLARMTAHIERQPHVHEPLVCLGWPISVDGRKRRVGTALVDGGGDVVALAESLWIELDERAAKAFHANA